MKRFRSLDSDERRSIYIEIFKKRTPKYSFEIEEQTEALTHFYQIEPRLRAFKGELEAESDLPFKLEILYPTSGAKIRKEIL